MPRNYTREQQRRYREELQKQANRVASRLMGKKDTLFLPGDEWEWQSLKGRQMGMSSYNSLLINNPRTSFILSDMEGV
jgi:hypothetical protein